MRTTDASRVTVSLPYHRCRAHLRRAVESILSQSYGNLLLVVINDGDTDEPWDLLSDISDRRLVRHNLGAQRGRYFADHVVHAATSDEYFLIQDADDWSDESRLAHLMDSLTEHNADFSLSSCRCYVDR